MTQISAIKNPLINFVLKQIYKKQLIHPKIKSENINTQKNTSRLIPTFFRVAREKSSTQNFPELFFQNDGVSK